MPVPFRHLRVFDVLFICFFLILNSLLVIFRDNLPNWQNFFILHFVIVGAVWIFLYYSRTSKNRINIFLRDWYQILGYTFIYKHMHHFNFLIHPDWMDRSLMKVEYVIFHSQPSIILAQHTNIVWHETLHFAYGSYYFMIPVFSVILYFKNKKNEFYQFVTAASTAFFISYLMFVLIPVQGPRFELANEGAIRLPGWIFSKFVYYIQDTQAIRGGCMPSSHCAVALVVMFFALKYEKVFGRILMPLVFLLCIATVYGRYHYGTDVIAGIIIGIAAFLLCRNLQFTEEVKTWNENNSPGNG